MSKNKTAPAAEAEAQETAAAQTEAAEEAAAQQTEAAAADDGLQKQFDELNDRYLRMAAEYDNFRRRSQREREQAYGDAVIHTASALLPVYDNLERAIKAETADAEYKKGVEMTMSQLVECLEKLGITRIEAEPGTVFDPNLHNAVMHIDDENLGENVIAAVFQQGFIMGDRVVRHSFVQVAN